MEVFDYVRWRIGLAIGRAVCAIGYRLLDLGWSMRNGSARLYRSGWR